MFSNAGKKIQGVVSVLFVIGIVLIILSCIAMFFGFSISFSAQVGQQTAMTISAIITIIMLLLSIFGLWIGCLFYYAFGKIAESVEEQNELTKKLIDAVSGCKSENMNNHEINE